MALLYNDFIVIKLEAVQWPPTTVTSGDVFQASVRLNDASDSWRPRLGDSMHLVTEFIPLELPPGVESVHDNIETSLSRRDFLLPWPSFACCSRLFEPSF